MSRPSDPSLVDEATGLSNERHFRIIYDFAFAGGDRGIPLTVVMIQVDGADPARGGGDVDEGVVRTGALLGGTTREMDVAAHLGGGRFLCLLVDCNFQGGVVFADRVRTLAQSLRSDLNLALSLGMASYEDGMEEPDELLDAAKRCLAGALADGGDSLVTTRDL